MRSIRRAIAALALAVSPFVVLADTATGLQWLSAQQASDGSYVSAADIATPYQATSEAIRALRALGQGGQTSGAVSFINGEAHVGTEYLTRKIVANLEAGIPAPGLLTTLTGYQNRDDSFGEFSDYQGNVLDTAYALESLAIGGQSKTPRVSNALMYLIQNQRSDGSWNSIANESSVHVTAVALRALWAHRQNYPLTTYINKAKDFLLAARGANQLWAETHDSALALIAILPALTNRAPVRDSVDALQQQQSPNGSWSNSVYTTALALRVLSISAAPSPDEILVNGRVLDADTGLALSGMTAALEGPSSQTAVTDASGTYSFRDLTPGSYTLTLTKAGYATLVATTTLGAGSQTNFGDLHLTKQQQGATTATIRGVVSAAGSGQPIAGALVTASGAGSTTTAANGQYQIPDVPVGTVQLSASAQGYGSATATATASAGGIIVFSPRLAAGDQPVEGSVLLGTITDAMSGSPLSGVSVGLSGASTAATTTDSSGGYRIEGLVPGNIDIAVAKEGYDSIYTGTQVGENTTIRFSPQLYLADTSPPGANTAEVFGVVMDSQANAPLAGVALHAEWTGGATDLVTGSDGLFEVADVRSPEVRLSFTKAGYQTVLLDASVSLLEDLDLGQIRMRPADVEQLIPDLTVVSVDAKSQAAVDPQTLNYTGVISAVVRNIGSAATAQDFRITAFVDIDNDNALSSADLTLGSSVSTGSIAVEESQTIEISISAQVPFRDPAIHVKVDSLESVVETNEKNNIQTSMAECRRAPITDVTPRVKWHWLGSPENPQFKAVYGPAMVGQLSDDNGDGKIDALDTPDIIIYANGPGTSAALTAIDGATGETLWQTIRDLGRIGSPAIGDIDNDGLLEIVASNYNRTALLAFEHDGSLKWSAPSGPTFNGDSHGARDGIAIADLNGDGNVEIIHGRRVYNGNGSLLWQGAGEYGGQTSYGFLPIVADVNLDGLQEVIAGRTLYSSTGKTLWTASTLTNGFTAVGNFDSDDFAEIVLVAGGRVYVLEHTGQIKWGPVTIPGGGTGGPPTVADMDGDGAPEIGVAGSSRYVVLETDGSIKWTRVTQDTSSNRTGSSVFDLDGDGRAEVLYADELVFRVMDGQTGAVRASIPNWSGTTLEYPVIADIDGDSYAEILIGSQPSTVPNPDSLGGLRALEGNLDEWMPTRSIWNQHSYHITNINDDGTIPRHEEPSWLKHNTYRLNSFLDRNPLDAPDVSASLIRLFDLGGGTQSLTARIGNGGLLAAPTGLKVSFYSGDPASGGTLIQTVTLESVMPGRYVDVETAPFSGASIQDIYVVADPDNRVAECDELNNVHHVPFRAAQALGQITVSTDAASYGPNAEALLSADARNVGSLANAYTVELIVEDLDGGVVVRFGPEPIGTLTPGQAADLDRVWSTLNTRTGSYILRGILRRDDGSIVDESTSGFDIVTAAGPIASLRTTTDKPTYHTTDRVTIANLARNLSSNQAISGATINLEVQTASGAVVFSHTLNLNELSPGATAERTIIQPLEQAAEGMYTVSAVLSDGAGRALATASAEYRVQDDPARSLSGSVTATPTEGEAGDPVQCIDTLRNTGAQDFEGLAVRQSVVRLDADGLERRQESVIDLGAGETRNLQRSVDTSGLDAGDYACLIEARIAGSYQTLGHAVFKLTRQPIALEANLKLGERGRVLVLLDGGESGSSCSAVTGVELWAGFASSLPNGTEVRVQVLDGSGQVLDSESASVVEAGSSANRNNGSAVNLAILGLGAEIITVDLQSSAPLPAGLRLVAEALDKKKKPIETLASGPIDPVCAPPMQAGETYGAFEVSSVRTTAAGGDPHGTSNAPDLSVQRSFLENALISAGWTYTIVSHKDAFAREMRSGGYHLYALFAEQVKLDEQVQKELREAVYRGEGLLEAGSHDQRHHRFDDAIGVRWKGKHSGAQGLELFASPLHPGGYRDLTLKDKALRVELAGAQRQGRFTGVSSSDVAVASYTYGAGRSVYVGFDLLAEAARTGAAELFRDLLLNGLQYVQPVMTHLSTGQVAPLTLTVENHGIATAGRALLDLDDGVLVVDDGGAERGGIADLVWTFDLDAGEETTFMASVQLPRGDDGVQVFEATIQTGIDPYTDQVTVRLDLQPQATAGFSEAQTLAASDRAFKKVQNWLDKAGGHLAAARYESALSDLTQASDEAISAVHPQAESLRRMIAEAIRQTGMQL